MAKCEPTLCMIYITLLIAKNFLQKLRLFFSNVVFITSFQLKILNIINYQIKDL